MIQTFLVEAPLGSHDPDATIATLESSLARLQVIHPALRGATLNHADGMLFMRLRCAGADRWRTQRAARMVATAMLGRVKISHTDAKLTLLETQPGQESLTKEQGRTIGNGRGRRVRRWDHIPWWDGKGEGDSAA